GVRRIKTPRMDAMDLLFVVPNHGADATIVAGGEKIRVSGPKRVYTPAVRTHKPALLAILRDRDRFLEPGKRWRARNRHWVWLDPLVAYACQVSQERGRRGVAQGHVPGSPAGWATLAI